MVEVQKRSLRTFEEHSLSTVHLAIQIDGDVRKIRHDVLGDFQALVSQQRWVEGGARITGGSSLRFSYETRKYLEQPKEERGTPHTVLCGCGVDEFNYGIHAFAQIVGIMGPDVGWVRWLGARVQDVDGLGKTRLGDEELRWSRHRLGPLRLHPVQRRTPALCPGCPQN
jgi:hypothetical protein